jgi:hypothetical protein
MHLSAAADCRNTDGGTGHGIKDGTDTGKRSLPPICRTLFRPSVLRNDLVMFLMRNGVDAARCIDQSRTATSGADVEGKEEVARHRRASVTGSKKWA